MQKEAMEILLQLNMKESNNANYKCQRECGQYRNVNEDKKEEASTTITLTSTNGEISWKPRATRGRGRRNSKSRYDKSRAKCYNCEKFGHYASECRILSNNKVEEKANYVEETSQKDETSLLTCKNNERSEDNQLYLDSGASNHMCGIRSMFTELDETVKGNMAFGDKSKVAVKGKGNILIRLKNGKHQITNSSQTFMTRQT
jgi:hypothetical protein